MPDPLSIIDLVAGLVETSAKIASIPRKDMRTSISGFSEEMDELHYIFGQVQMLPEDHAQKRPNRSHFPYII